MEIRTDRLLLRPWRDEDLDPFAALCADPVTMKYFPHTQTREETEAMMTRMRAFWEKNEFGPFAVEVPGVADCIGFVGLMIPRFEAHFTPCVEIGWRLAAAHHGKGYATEAAAACLEDGFTRLKLKEIFAFTVPMNLPSRRVMEKTGMSYVGEFEHPKVAEGHVLRPHVLYSIKK
jgi:ribosomal-protein-alanine N-acetyltransferase